MFVTFEHLHPSHPPLPPKPPSAFKFPHLNLRIFKSLTLLFYSLIISYTIKDPFTTNSYLDSQSAHFDKDREAISKNQFDL